MLGLPEAKWEEEEEEEQQKQQKQPLSRLGTAYSF